MLPYKTAQQFSKHLKQESFHIAAYGTQIYLKFEILHLIVKKPRS